MRSEKKYFIESASLWIVVLVIIHSGTELSVWIERKYGYTWSMIQIIILTIIVNVLVIFYIKRWMKAK